ncbi:MAG: PASTA domain-containing protein [Candidatus Acidiferrum sp.]
MSRTNVYFLLSAVSLAMMMSTPLTAQQVTPVPQPTIVPMVGQVTLTGECPTRKDPTAECPVTVIIPKGATSSQGQVVTLSQGQMLRVFGRLEFTSNAQTTQSSTDYVSVYAECKDPGGHTANVEQDFGENFLGPNTSPGPNYPNYPVTGHMVLTPSTLITATTSGPYSCQLLAGAEKTGSVVGYQGTNNTFLGLSAPIDPPDAFSWGTFASCFWKGPNTGTHSYDNGCLYLGGPNGAQSVDLFSPTVVLPTAPPGYCLPCAWLLVVPPTNSAPLARPAIETTNSPEPAAFVDVNATLQVSLCGQITDECDFARFGSPDTKSVTFDSYLELDQIDAAGQLVHASVGPTQETVIDNYTHHDMIYHSMSTLPVYPSSGAPQFRPKLVLTWKAGSTAKVDHAQVVAFTSFHGHAQLLPNVVGLNVSAATNTLTASGYAAGVVSNTLSTAPPGSVVSQFPSGGSVIELPGSVVDLTVSAPHQSVSVPDVLGLAESKAVDSINAALLSPKVSFAKLCTYLGNVALESPHGQSVVPAGTTINITVDSGTKATCGPPK